MSNTELAVAEEISQDNAPLIYVEGGLKPFVDRVRAEVSAEVPDITTRKGRDRIASLAAKVSKSKSAVEKPGRDYLRHLKAQPKVVEAELREFVQAMDALRDETRKPLTEWEDAEKARVNTHAARMDSLRQFSEFGELDAAGIKFQINGLKAINIDESWEEFEAEAHRVKAASLESLKAALTAREKHEAEQAELAELRRKQAEQEQKDRDERIAREAEEKAKRENAEALAKAKADAEQAEQRRIDAEKKAEADRIAAAEKAESDRIEAEQAATRRAEQAAQAERNRIAAEQAEAKRLQEERELNTAHRASVNSTAMQAFIDGGMPEECAKQAVILIVRGMVPNIRINY